MIQLSKASRTAVPRNRHEALPPPDPYPGDLHRWFPTAHVAGKVRALLPGLGITSAPTVGGGLTFTLTGERSGAAARRGERRLTSHFQPITLAESPGTIYGHEDPYKACTAATLLDVASSLGINSLADGIETEGEVQWVQAHRVKFVQEYLLWRPAPMPVSNAPRPQRNAESTTGRQKGGAHREHRPLRV